MSEIDSLRDVLNRMGRAAIPVEDDESARALRVHTLPRIEAMIHAQAAAPRRVPRRALWLAVALLPLAPVALWGIHRLATGQDGTTPSASVVNDRGSAQVVSVGGVVSLDVGERVPIGVGDRIETFPAGAAHLSLPAAHVAVTGDTHVRVEALEASSEHIHVRRGLISVTVPTLGAERSFIVTTADSRVVVHGTAFTVQSSEWTSVAVSSGLVQVVHGDRAVWLHAGEHWSSRPPDAHAVRPVTSVTEPPAVTSVTEPPAVTAGADTSDKAGTADAEQPGGVTPPSRREEPHAAAPSIPVVSARQAAAQPVPKSPRAFTEETLAVQNDLFRNAMLARRQGRGRDALQLLDRLLIEHPSAPIIHEARVEQMRLLAEAGDRQAAARAARRYLSLYPEGFAAAEAHALID